MAFHIFSPCLIFVSLTHVELSGGEFGRLAVFTFAVSIVIGEYGFYDALSVADGKIARKYYSLDQGMILIAINNYLHDGAIRKRFHADTEMKKCENLLTAEKFFEETSQDTPSGSKP